MSVEQEASDSYGGKWDLLCTTTSGDRFVVELVTGESKGHEAIHVQKAITAGLPIFCLCAGDQIRERIRRYCADQHIVESESVVLMTANDVAEELRTTTSATMPAQNTVSAGAPEDTTAAAFQ